MRVFKTKWFERFAKKNEIEDELLQEAVARAEKSLVDADLGHGVLKQRIARPGRGRSKGYRTIILFQREKRAFFVYGFAKSKQENLRQDELKAYKDMAHIVLSLSEDHLTALIKTGDFAEVQKNVKELSK